jgi:hypothetical protein
VGGGGTNARGKEMGKGCKRVNMVQILCIHVCKWKNDICSNCSRKRRRGINENDGGDEFTYDIFDIF